jgi:hypothetical protein
VTCINATQCLCRKRRYLTKIKGRHMWSRVTQTLRSVYTGHDYGNRTFKVITSTLPLREPRCIVFALTRPGSSTRSIELKASTITIIHQRYAYRVFIHHLISYFTDCVSYWVFLDRRLLLIKKLLNEEELLCVLSLVMNKEGKIFD